MAGRENRLSESPLFVSPPPRDHRHTPLVLPPRTRYPGDGLDYRRPVTTAAGGMSSAVIDLTSEDDTQSAWPAPEAFSAVASPEPGPSRANTRHRLPGIQLPEDREASRGPQQEHQQHNNHYPESRSRYPLRASDTMDRRPSNSTLATSSRRLPRPWEPAQRSITPHPTGASNTIDLTGDDDDDVVFTEVRPRIPRLPQLNVGRPEITAGTGTVARGLMERIFGMGGRPGDTIVGAAVPRPANAPHMPQHGRPPAVVIDFNYMTVGFAVGGEPARPPTPHYEAPPPAEPGFTRSPGEDEEIVCPNCGYELCAGEDEVKQQVWVIKTCGHVSRLTGCAIFNPWTNNIQAYCGECAQNRVVSQPRGKGKAKVDASLNAIVPMKKCSVLGCGVSAAGKAMLRVYVDG